MKRAAARAISPPARKSARQLESYTDAVVVSKQTEPAGKIDLPQRRTSLVPLSAADDVNLKIMSWNCDGLEQYLSKDNTTLDNFLTLGTGTAPNGSELSFLSRFIRLHQPAFLLLQEVHFPRTQHKSLLRRLHLDAPGYIADCCLPTSNRYAGVVTLVSRNVKILQSSQVAWDHEGRVLVHELDNLFVINVYCLNSSEYPWRSSTGRVEGTRAERKREFQRLLANEMHTLAKQKPCIVLGDFNVSRYSIDTTAGMLRVGETHALNRKQFNELFCPFVDVIRQRHPHERKYTWHSRQGTSEARVDLILASQNVHIITCDTMETADRGQSDHSPLFAQVAMKAAQKEC